MNKKLHVYLGNLTPRLQEKFLGLFSEAEKNGVTANQFIEAWNSYAMSIEEHIFITGDEDNPPVLQPNERK